MTRTSKAIRNIRYEMAGQIIHAIFKFALRMTFISVLGKEYLGLNSLFFNIMSVLSFAELGIGTSITFSLFKPLADGDMERVNSLMSLLKKAYIIIGLVILAVSVGTAPFISFFIKDAPDIGNIPIVFLLFVLNFSISYFFSYKRVLIVADQKAFINSLYRYAAMILTAILQMIALFVFSNYIIYLAIAIVITLTENIAISRKVNKMYPELKSNNVISLPVSVKKIISKNTRAMIWHRLGGIVVHGTDSILISKYVSLVSVGIYSNYFLITNLLSQVYGMIFGSLTSSIGNLGATADKEKKYFIFRCINFVNFWIYSFSTTALVVLMNPFIQIWLGEDFVFSGFTPVLIAINFYLIGRRQSVNIYKESLGLFWYDRYKALFEAILNLSLSLILVRSIGIDGVLLGTAIATLIMPFWFEAKVLYKYGFNRSVWTFVINYALEAFITIALVGITLYASNLFDSFVIKMGLSAIIPNLILLILFYRSKRLRYVIKGIVENREKAHTNRE